MAQPQIVPKFQVEELEGNHTIEKIVFETGKGKRPVMVRKQVEVPAGYMVYLPNGDSIRCSKERLKELGFDVPPSLVDLETGDETEQAPQVSLKRRSEARTRLSPIQVV